MKINLRTIPWFTSETIRFLNNLLRWYLLYARRKINIMIDSNYLKIKIKKHLD